MRNDKAILIAGPTASGKSALALSLAEALQGAVINADSMQVYQDLALLSARPTETDVVRAPHKLYGHVPGGEAYSAARYAAEAAAAIADARAAGRVPIVVGGTGLYFKALLEGLSPIPAIPDDIRNHWRTQAERIGAAGLHAVLAGKDPEMAARLKPTDPQRIVRALEVLEATGRSLARWQAEPGEPVLHLAETIPLVLTPERSELRARCDARFDRMIEAGALAEVVRLLDLALDPDLPVMRALGVRPLANHLLAGLPLDEAVRAGKAETRQYAKRQETWFRGQMAAWRAITPAASTFDAVLALVEESG